MADGSAIPKTVRVFLWLALGLNVLGLGCELIARKVLHLGWPYNSPLLFERPAVDLFNFAPEFQHVHSPDFFSPAWPLPYMYPAPVAPLYGLFLHLPHPGHVFEATLVLILLAAAVMFGRHLRQRGMSTFGSIVLPGGALLLSYPVAFELKQGNMELFVCVLVGLAIWFFVTDRLHAAAVCIGIAGAMKIFPFIYLGLFIAKSRYRPLITAFVTAIVATVASLFYLDPSIVEAWHGVQSGLDLYQKTIALHIFAQTGFDHSLFALVKLTPYLMHPHPGGTSPAVLRVFMAIVGVGGIVLFFSRIRHLPVINQVTCLCVASILLPPVSYDYTLLHLYIPWVMLVLFAMNRAERFTSGLRVAFICLAIATSIETEFIFRGHSFGGQFKAVALMMLMFVALRFPFEVDSERKIVTT